MSVDCVLSLPLKKKKRSQYKVHNNSQKSDEKMHKNMQLAKLKWKKKSNVDTLVPGGSSHKPETKDHVPYVQVSCLALVRHVPQFQPINEM